MKKIYGFLGAVALFSLASCSNEGPDAPEVNEGQKGDLYMTMNLATAGANGSRTATPNQGSEFGQDDENVIATALVIFAKENATTTGRYEVFAVLNSGQISGASNSYTATYKMDRSIILNDVKGKEEGVQYTMFVIANPTDAIVQAYEAAAAKYATDPQDVQSTFALTADDYTYWAGSNHFLMSSATIDEDCQITIKEADVDYGTHISATTALNLGKATIQRAMSRFDIATSAQYTVFTDGVKDEKSPINDITVTFDAVALVNQAKSAYMFKVTAADNATLAGKTISFENDRLEANKGHWAFTPDQNYDYLSPLFDNLAAGTSETMFTGDPKDLSGFTFDNLAELSGERNDFTRPSDVPEQIPSSYTFWRYCMENTNPDDAENQRNGNSTGIIFRAEITGTGISEETTALYAYGNIVFGDAVGLRDYVFTEGEHTDDADVYAVVSNRYKAAIEAYNEGKQDSEKFVYGEDEEAEDVTGKKISGATATDLAVLDTILVKEQKFTIYRPQDGKFYCYYFYWNRHNDNGLPTIMGNMEFATVRNNVYKLSVEKVLHLGHPAIPGDDPDPEDPDDPNEEDEFWVEIQCEILDWEVRVNGIVF